MKSILDQDSGASPDIRATSGGKMPVKDIPYSPPKGPASQTKESPGLGGTNHGNCGSQGRH